MSDQAESSTEPAEEVQVIDGCHPDDGVDRREDDGSGSSRVRTISEGYGITEEQEKTLLAGEDGEDLDVIDCFVKDFDSDLEEEFLQKDAENVELVEKKASGTVTEFKADNIKVLKVVRIVRTPEESGNATEEHEEPLKGFEEEATAPDGDGEEEDEDVIQIVEENADDLLEETPAGAEMAEERPHVSVHVSDDTENERILSKPLVKQVVMDVSGEVGEEDELKDPDGGAGSPKSHADDRDEGSMGTQEDSDAEQPLVIADSVEANVETMSGWHQEDPDVLQLKLDLHQNMGEMDYEPDEDDHRDNRANEEEQIERRIQIKEEPKSPVKNRLERILLEVEDIPTIVLSSDDDFVDLMPQKKKKGKKKSKKKNRQRTKSECSVIEVITPITVEESLPAVKSSKSLYPNDSMTVDAELLKTGFRMELRKRKSATVLEENGTPPPTKRSGRSSTGQSKSRTSIISTESFKISEDIRQEKPPKKTFAQKSTFQPVSTADKLKINSLFKDCEKADEVPIRILNDGMPLFDEDSDNLFERAFEKPHQTVKKHVAAAPLSRQTMLIDALPRATVKNVHKPSNEQPSSSKSKLVPKIRQLEDDLAMTSSDDDSPLIKNQNSAKGVTGSPVPKKPGRKRGRAPKQHIEDYFSPSPGRKKDSTETQGKIGSKSQVKRRKKRSRISSCSSNSEEETVQSISLAGTSSTITTNRSVTISTEQEVEVDEQQAELPKTNELSVILSPLTKEQIDQRSKCITPKKVRALSKATQTQLEGLTWRIDLNQIDFHSEYFEKIYQLITIGREVRNLPRRNNSLEGVIIAGRNAVQPPNPPERSPQQQPAAAVNGRARSNIEQLLFERADEVECVATARVDPSARAQMVRSIRANFRIPKITKQPSRSPQDVTSSTHHDIEQQHYRVDEPRQPSSGGYSNDRLVAPEPRRHITVGDRSPLRVENSLNNAVVANRPVVSAPATAGNAARPLVPLRRTIRNDNVQSSMVAPHQPQLQPVENGYQAYRPQPEQVPAPQYQPVFQQQPQPQQFGAYMAPGQELDIKPNIAMALAAPQASMLAPVVMRNPYFDFMYQMNMMQILPQQMQFPAMNVAGQMFSGPSAVPTFASTTAATSNQIPATAPSLSAQMMPRPVGQQDEESEQISQIFGCIDHLKGRCIKNPCQYPHTLPSQGTLRQTLLGSTQEVVMTTYHFIVSQDDLFLRYFCVYTEVMGHRNMRHQLIDAVPHCEQNKRAFPYYGYIVTGLTITGTLSRSKAVQLVLEKHRKINFDQIHVLISLIVDTGDDVALFLPWLDEFSQVPGYHFEIPSINRLLKFCVRASRSPNAVPLHGTLANVAKLIFRLVMSVAAGKEPFVDTDTLIEYAELLMRSNLGLDHEKIMHKYGKNELSSSAVRH